MTKKDDNVLGMAVLAYLQASSQARIERERLRQQTHVTIAQEKEETRRCRIKADADMHRETEITARIRVQSQAGIAIAKEQRIAFQHLCDTLKESLASGALTLTNIRQQFNAVCQLLIERDLPSEERIILIAMLSDLIGQQNTTMETSRKAIDSFSAEKYLPHHEENR